MSPWRGKPLAAFEHDLPMFEEFLEAVPDAMVGVQEDGEILFANSMAAELFRRSQAEMIGDEIDSLIPPRFHSPLPEGAGGFFAARMDQPFGPNIHMYLRRADASEFPAEINATEFLLDETRIEVASIRDVTDRVHSETEHKRLEKELALNQSRRLESVGELAGGIAHDFNNLLGVIINYAELAAESIDDPDVREDVEQIQYAGQRAADLTRQLLIFSRREIVMPVAVALNEILVNIEKLLRRTIGERIELSSIFATDLRTVIIDPGQLEQIVMNLAVNARDAMPDGGLLEIETSNVLIDDEYMEERGDGPLPGKYVLIRVSDSGTGMDPDVAARAFEPFFTTKGRTQGSGLGLATVYGIVKQAKGEIFIYSELGHGTSVKVYLPASDVTVAEWVAEQAPTRGVGHGEAVLVVEDEHALRRLVERVLNEKGYVVTATANAEQALELIRSESTKIDLLLSDVVMPGMQGSELAERASKLRPGLRTLLMSGYSEAMSARLDGHDDGFDLVEKPFTRTQLLNSVSTSLAATDPPVVAR